jgi:conjugal transfer pilus assembly protein TraK
MSRISRKPAIRILSATLLLASLEAGAAQLLRGRPDDTLAATVSRAEPTLIRIEGRRIRHVFGAEGEFDVKPDREAGTAFLKPTGERSSISAYVADDAGQTWKLLLAVTDAPADTIVIRGSAPASNPGRPGKDLPRAQAIKQAVLTLTSDDQTGLAAQTISEPVPLWQEASFVRVKTVDGPVHGEKFLLTNLSAKLMTLDEREFYRRGVLAVALEKPVLAPVETGAVYVVSEGGE